MNFEEASKILSEATRSELRDHAFGDREIYWEKDGKVVAEGYFGSGMSSVSIGEFSFEKDEARKLAELGTVGAIERNDETGPDTYTEGDVMPGLSVGDVFHELTGKYLDE